MLRETFEPELLAPISVLTAAAPTQTVIEVGPRMNFSTAFSTNAVSVCASTGLGKVTRLERSRRYILTSTRPLTEQEKTAFAGLVHDRMTEEVYAQPASSFKVTVTPAPVFTVPVMEQGRAALEEINEVSILGYYHFRGFEGVLWCCRAQGLGIVEGMLDSALDDVTKLSFYQAGLSLCGNKFGDLN